MKTSNYGKNSVQQFMENFWVLHLNIKWKLENIQKWQRSTYRTK